MGVSEGSDVTRLVLADDSRAVLGAVRDLLDSEPDLHVVGTAHDGPGTARLVLAEQPDVVVIDLHMPGGGPDLVRRLHERTPAPAIVCFSADTTGREMMLAVGCVAYAVKGDAEVDLVALVRRVAHRVS